MKNSTKCIIVDGNQQSREAIATQLATVLTNYMLVGTACNCTDAVLLITQHSPDIVFADTDACGSDILAAMQQFAKNKFALIVTGSNAKYALQAIKVQAIDYLLKPIDIGELSEACKKALDFLGSTIEGGGQRANQPQKPLTSSNDEKLSIKIGSFYELVSAEDIVFCKADNNYTEICLSDKRKVLISKTLKYYEGRLSSQNFCRIHQSFLVNMSFVKSIEKGKASHIVLKDGTTLDVAQARRESVFKMLGV
jgi:two-component system, LytTR family, response regulator